jgi:hypothetical protein
MSPLLLGGTYSENISNYVHVLVSFFKILSSFLFGFRVFPAYFQSSHLIYFSSKFDP